MERLRRARTHDGYARWERRTSALLLGLALLFLVVLLLVTLAPWQRTALTVVSAALWVVFTFDYGARLYLTQERWRFVRRHPLDLLVLVLPFLRPLARQPPGRRAFAQD